MKFTNYTVFVRAFTSMGGSDWSKSVTVVTDEDGELNIVTLCGVGVGMGTFVCLCIYMASLRSALICS